MRHMTTKGAAACIALAAASVFSNASAQSVSINPAAATVGTGGGATSPASIDIVFTGGGAVTGYQSDIAFDNTQLTPTLTIGNATSCVIVGGNVIRVLDFDAGGNALPSGVACSVAFSVAAGQTGGTVYNLNVTGTLCSDAGSNPVACTENDGTITVVATSGPTITFAPPAGTITFPAGGSGTNSAPIPINIDGTGGTVGQSTSVSCAFTPAATGLSVSGGPFTVNSGDAAGDVDGTFNVVCAYAAGSPRTGTLACTSTPTVGGPTTTNYTVNCPAGGATPPTIAYNPAVGSTIQFNGAAAPISQTITVTQTSTGQAGTSVAVGPCTLGGTNPGNFTTTGSATINGGTAGQSGTINVTCTTQNSTATLTCPEVTNNGVGTSTVNQVFNLNCPNPQPEIVTNPASGSGLNLSGAPSTTASGSIGVQNTGFAPLTITGCTITGTGATNFGTPTVSGGGTIAAGGTGTIGVTCTTPGAGGTTAAATLTCTTNDADEGTITFPLACTAIVVSIPALGVMGKGLMALLVLGLGLVGFGLHRRFAA